MRSLLLAALAAVAWLFLCTGTASAAPAELDPLPNTDTVAAAADELLDPALPLVQDLPTSPDTITKTATEAVAVPAAPTPVPEAEAVLGGAQELITAVEQPAVVQPVTAVVESTVGEVVDVVDAVVAPVLTAPPLPSQPTAPELPLPSAPLPLPGLQLPDLQPSPDPGQTPPASAGAGTTSPTTFQPAPGESISKATAPAPSGRGPAPEQPALSTSGLDALLDVAAATAPPAAASAAPYIPQTGQPAPAPFQQSDVQGLSPTGSSGGGSSLAGAADAATPWSAPSPPWSARIAAGAWHLPAAPSFDPGSRPG